MEEFYSGVAYYGIGKIIKDYAYFPSFLPCPVGIQHGWSTLASVHDARYDAAENWFWSKDLAKKYETKFEGLNIRVVGSPFLYLLTNLNYVESKEKKGSIVFPCHSSAFVKIECDFDKYATMLDLLPDEYKPITVCMYYLDIQNGLDSPFRNKGFEIINNGDNLFDAEFLKNFIKNTHGKKYAFSNQMTSALLFASTMGLTSFFYGPEFQTDSTDINYQDLDYTQHHRQWERQYDKYFKFTNCDLQQQQEFVYKELGKAFVLSRKEMNEILWKAVFRQPYFDKLFKAFKDWIRIHVPLVYPLYSIYKNR